MKELKEQLEEFRKGNILDVLSYIHLHINLKFLCNNESDLYNKIFKEHGVNQTTIEFCGYISNGLIFKMLREKYKDLIHKYDWLKNNVPEIKTTNLSAKRYYEEIENT